jgi:hypothetical protein
MKFDKLMKNKYLYYAAVALMVINVLGYVAMGSIECILVLGGAAYLAQHFTQNRTADIFIGLFVANILFGCGRLREGMEGATGTIKKGASELVATGKSEGDQDKVATGLAVHSAAEKCEGDCKKRKAAAAAAKAHSA